MVFLEAPASGEKQDRPAPVLLQNSHVDDDIQISSLNVFYEMDGRKSHCIKELLDCFRGEDLGDLRS